MLLGRAATIVLLVMIATAARADVLGSERDQLKRGYFKSLSAQVGRQVVGLPLKDGRSIKLTIEYVDDGNGIRVKRRPNNTICVTFDRSEAVKASLAQDAMLVCGATRACNHVEAYVADLHQRKTSEPQILFEEFVSQNRLEDHKRIISAMKSWERTKMYARQWLAMFERYTLVFQLHEIGHVALLHKPTARPITLLRNEAQADGFARYVANLSKFSTSPSIAILLDRLREETNEFEPPGACRIEALASPLTKWARKYFPQDKQLARVVYRATKAAHSDDRPFGFGLPAPSAAPCLAFAKSFREGLLKAATLVDQNTRLVSNPRWGERCPR